jgi:hypothetical protein
LWKQREVFRYALPPVLAIRLLSAMRALTRLSCSQHEENLIRFGAFASTTQPSDATPPRDAPSTSQPSEASQEPSDTHAHLPASASADPSLSEPALVTAARAASGEDLDEPALFLRAVAANMQAGKKVRSSSDV